MDGTEANTKYATILCLDVPQGTEFGIDKHCWAVGPNFKGVKLIPPGLHFVFYSAANKYGGSSAPRIGFFAFLRPGEVLVRKWSPDQEDFFDKLDEDETGRYIAGVKRFDFDRFLGPFPLDKIEEQSQWTYLTCFITPRLIARLNPITHKISSTAAPYDSDSATASAATDQKPIVIAASETPFYSDVPKRLHGAAMTPQQITRLNFDKSALLEKLIQTSCPTNDEEVLGELQFAFVSFLLGQSFESFEHWKELVILLCGCDESLSKRSQLFSSYALTMFHQLKEVPEDFFLDIVSGKNFLGPALKSFFEIASGSTDGGLTARAQKLKAFAEARFGFSFAVEEFDFDDEDAPVVVENV